LFSRGLATYVLDGEQRPATGSAGPGFSDADRKRNIRPLGEVAKLFSRCRLIVAHRFVSPFRSDRDKARSLVKTAEFHRDSYAPADLDVCESREPQGPLMPRPARRPDQNFTGISSPYKP